MLSLLPLPSFLIVSVLGSFVQVLVAVPVLPTQVSTVPWDGHWRGTYFNCLPRQALEGISDRTFRTFVAPERHMLYFPQGVCNIYVLPMGSEGEELQER